MAIEEISDSGPDAECVDFVPYGSGRPDGFPWAEMLRRQLESPTRNSVDFAAIEQAFARERIELSAAAGTFLRTFGGAVVRYSFNAVLTDILAFHADEAVCGLGDGALANLEERLNVGRLCPIGRFCFGMRLLLMNANGAVYGVGDEGVARIASSGEEAIDLILSGKLSDRPFDEFTLY